MLPPAKITIKPLTDIDGEYHPSENKIDINSKISKDRQCQALFHEYIHSILEITGNVAVFKGNVEQEESMVLALERHLYIFVDESKLKRILKAASTEK